jgi:integrase
VVGEWQTLGQYLTTWPGDVRSQLRPSSHWRYSDYARHLVAGLGKVPLAKLTPQHVQSFYTAKLAEGLSSSTVHHLHGVLHRALKDAVHQGLVQRNVTESVHAPRRQRPEMMVLSEDQGKRLLAATQGDRFEALYVLALTTGMRQGELLGLRWQDVDLERSITHVRMSVQEADGRFILAEVKTSYSRRNIALTRVAVRALRAHRARQNEERLAMGPKWDSASDLVFPNGYGGIMIPDNLAKRFFKAALLRAGLSDMRFHDLRHTAATLLLSRGVHPKVVSEMLGHADIATTLRTYGHVTPHMQQSALDVLEVLWSARRDAVDSNGDHEWQA